MTAVRSVVEFELSYRCRERQNRSFIFTAMELRYSVEGQKHRVLGSTRSGQFQGVFAALNREFPSGLYVTVGRLILSNGKQIADFATKGKLPSIQTSRAGIDAGGLMYRGDGSQSKLFSLLYPPNE